MSSQSSVSSMRSHVPRGTVKGAPGAATGGSFRRQGCLPLRKERASTAGAHLHPTTTFASQGATRLEDSIFIGFEVDESRFAALCSSHSEPLGRGWGGKVWVRGRGRGGWDSLRNQGGDGTPLDYATEDQIPLLSTYRS